MLHISSVTSSLFLSSLALGDLCNPTVGKVLRLRRNFLGSSLQVPRRYFLDMLYRIMRRKERYVVPCKHLDFQSLCNVETFHVLSLHVASEFFCTVSNRLGHLLRTCRTGGELTGIDPLLIVVLQPILVSNIAPNYITL